MRRYLSLRSLVLGLAIDHAAAIQYEYIVIGSGPGGGPLAADLARAGYTVLLLEAGSDYVDDPIYQDVNLATVASNDPRTRWDFFVKHSDDPERELTYKHMTWRTADGSFYVGLDPPEGAEQLGIWYPRAAVIGGCAMHNAAYLELPSDENWDYIANITGDDSWRASEMRKIYEEIENCHYAETGTEGHGFSGWLDTNRPDTSWPGSNATDGTAILKAIAEFSSDPSSAAVNMSSAELQSLVSRDLNGMDPNRDQLTGVMGIATHTDASGRRVSPANYIRKTVEEVGTVPFVVKTNAFVTRLVFDELADPENPAVMAVEYVVGESAYGADPRYAPGRNTTRGFDYATREVIVAGGAFNTPQILKLSGLGPAEELRRHNITVLKDLPGVGMNLGDNYEGGVLSIANKSLAAGFGGPYSVQLKTSASQGNRDIFMWPMNAGFEGFWPGYPDDFGPNALTFAFLHRDQRSASGTVTLRSADPFEPPDINLRFFSGPGGAQDLRALVEAARFAHGAQARLVAPGIAPLRELHPCAGGDGDGDDDAAAACTEEAMAESLQTQAYSHHATGTCAIGDPADPATVLDSKFRVKGVRNLRVVDASVFPRPPGAFPVLPTFMISRKAAKAILEDA
ncbi:GMC oxidoreductase [Xylariomycetidae sp. FL2044]|nr:GMC oxidoreductase [Xylariomycetidae sp. FL2044]